MSDENLKTLLFKIYLKKTFAGLFRVCITHKRKASFKFCVPFVRSQMGAQAAWSNTIY